ncbi:MAG: GC-type dockerin domain-anchored protein [Phycisphaerales bacterium]
MGEWGGSPFRWTQPTGLVVLISGGEAFDVSADGSIVVGYGVASSQHYPLVWREQTGGVQSLPTPGFFGNRSLSAISGDGRVMAGQGESLTIGGTRGFRWTAETGAVLVPMFGAANQMYPRDLNHDGSIMVGIWDNAAGGSRRGFIWRYGQAPVSLSPLDGYSRVEIAAVSDDGSTIVGGCNNNKLGVACVWKNGSVFLLTDYLAARGVTVLPGTSLFYAHGVSAHGRVIAGYGIVPGNAGTSFRAEVPRCYADCDGSTSTPALNVVDFICFLNKFAAGDSYANCDGSTTPPVLNVSDFVCFQNSFAAGCT